uniref:Helicase C-terminal domain-containing protein n=1 Tax=Daucus carota subsp. sativus TaxID=79200 RepID=A0A161WTV5_DAUCS
MDVGAAESASPNSPSNFSSQRHFYLAVDRLQFKMETLVDLLGMAGRLPCLPMVVCCNTRDELDAISYALSNLSYLSATPLYSDLAEADRALVLDKFRQATIKWNRNPILHSEDKNDTENEEQKSRVVVATDACLPLIASGEAPVSARVLINYELPTKKETYMRRMATCLAADGIVINMVVGGEVVTLKGIEESSSLVIAEMPINLQVLANIVLK